MNDDDLADLIILARTLGVETQSEKIKDACQVVLKAAMASRSRLRRDRGTPEAVVLDIPPNTLRYGDTLKIFRADGQLAIETRIEPPATETAEVGTITWTQAPDTETR